MYSDGAKEIDCAQRPVAEIVKNVFSIALTIQAERVAYLGKVGVPFGLLVCI